MQEDAISPLQNPGPARREPNVLANEGARFLQVANTRKSHLVHNVRVVLCQNHRHRVRKACEFDGVRVLPILLVTQDEARPLILLIVQRTTWGPANAPQPQKVGLVHILKGQARTQSSSAISLLHATIPPTNGSSACQNTFP